MIHLPGNGESSEAWAPCSIGFAQARRLRRCRGRSRAFVSGRGVGVCLDVAEAGGAIRANGSLAAGRGLTRAEAARRSHAAVSILSKERQTTSWGSRLQRLRQQLEVARVLSF